MTIDPSPHQHDWRFVTNHLLVVVCIAQSPDSRMIDVAQKVGITERAVQGIVKDLVEEGYLVRRRVGRRNRYEINADLPLRHSETEHRTLGEMLSVLHH